MRAALALLLLAAPAVAQDWPPDVAAILEDASALCDGTFTALPDSVSQRDLNGDGRADWIVDSGAFQCSTSDSLYCGTHGCGVDTVIDGLRGSFVLHAWDTETVGSTTYLTAPNDQGGTSRFLWTGSEWQFQ